MWDQLAGVYLDHVLAAAQEVSTLSGERHHPSTSTLRFSASRQLPTAHPGMASTVAFTPAVAVGANVQHSRRTSSLWSVPRARPVAARASVERDGAAAAVQARSGRTIEECEADAVAGKFPAAPPLTRPQAPSGTPEIRPLVRDDIPSYPGT